MAENLRASPQRRFVLAFAQQPDMIPARLFPEVVGRGMAKYWYRIRLGRTVKADEVEDLKSELLRLFQSTEMPEISGNNCQLTTPLEPVAAGKALDRFSLKHGSAAFVAGGKLGE